MKLHEVINKEGFYWYVPTVLQQPIIVRIIEGEVWEIGSERPTTHCPGEFVGPIHYCSTVIVHEPEYEKNVATIISRNVDASRKALSNGPPSVGLDEMEKRTLTWNDYQARVRLWMLHVFGSRMMVCNAEERCDRFIEEVIELLQSLGYDSDRIATLTEYVYNRPVGKKFQEAGGVAVTFSALCDAVGIDMADAGEVELQRVWDARVIAKIQAKQQSKRDLHGPLPGREHAD